MQLSLNICLTVDHFQTKVDKICGGQPELTQTKLE